MTDYSDLVRSWESTSLESLSVFKVGALPEELLDLFEFRIKLQQMSNDINAVTFQEPEYNPIEEVKEFYENKEEENEQKRNALREIEKQDIQALKDEVAAYNKGVSEFNSHLADKLYLKHTELKKYKKTLDFVFKHYDITPSSVTVGHNLTEKTFRDMIHVSLSVCKKYDTMYKHNLIYRYATRLKESDGFFAVWTLSLAVILSYIFLPLIGIVNYVKLFRQVNDVSSDIEALQLARSLMCEVNYMNLIDPSKRMSTQGDPDTSEITERIQQQISEIKDYTEERENALNEANESISKYHELISEATSRINTVLNDRKNEISSALSECNAKIDELTADYHMFPYSCNESAVMSHKWVFARKYDKIDVVVTVPQKNLVFSYSTESERTAALNLCKLYLCNILLSVQPRKLDITISDPLYQGAEFAEFITPAVREYLHIVDTDFSTTIKELRKVTFDNIKRLGTKSIAEYNAEAEKEDRVTVPYKLLIIASGMRHNDQGETEGYDDKMQAYFQESVNQGVIIWVLDSANYIGMFKAKLSQEDFGDAPILEYTPELGGKTVEIWGESIAKFRAPILFYREKVANRHIPKDKWWTWDTVKGAELHFGIENGDPTKFTPIPLSDQNVHALMGGATGAGKSAAINQMIMSLITMYPPSELQLMFIDFKNVEAAKFTAGIEEDGSYMTSDHMTELNQKDVFYRKYSIIPHISVISGTTDGGYAQSLFQALNDEMARRQKILNKYGKMKVEDLRKELLEKYNSLKGTHATWHEMREDWEYYKPNILDKGLEIPRLVVICDEFQVMFNPEVVPGKTIDKITGLITLVTKLGRAMSCHLWFTSQSMKNTLSNDVKGNFSVRGALRCASDVSNELLGNGAASTITEKQGFMYTNTSAGEDPGQNKFWRVPFASDKEIAQICSDVNAMLKEYPHEKAYSAEFFDDKQLMPSYLIDEWYESNPEAFEGATSFILGERAEYSVNKAPITCKFSNDTGENMLIAGFDREDLLNLVLTVVDNVRHKTNGLLIFNIADKPAYDLVCPEKYVSEEMRPLCGPDIDQFELIDMLCDMVETRRETEEWDQTIYVVLSHWEQTPVFGYGKREERITKMLRFGPTVGIYFIIACAARSNDFAAYAPKQCKHRVCAMMPKDAFFFITTPMVEKFPTNKSDGIFAAYEFGANTSKFKIYQHKFEGKIESREIII